jgi:hypothetical protein
MHSYPERNRFRSFLPAQSIDPRLNLAVQIVRNFAPALCGEKKLTPKSKAAGDPIFWVSRRLAVRVVPA